MGSNWPRVKVSDVCELIVDCVNKTAPVSPVPTPYKMIRTPNIKNGRVSTDDCRCVDADTFAKWTRRATVERNDVLLTREAPLGEVGIVNSSEQLFLGQRIMQYRADESKLDPHFLLYSFLSPDLQHQFSMHEGSGSVVSHIRVGDCSKFELNLPPLAMQKRISEILRNLDNKITLNRQINQTLEQMAQTQFKSWFVDFDPVIDNALDAGNPIPDELQHRAEARKAVRESEGFKPLPDDVRQLFPDAFEESELGWVPKGWEYQSFGSLLASTIGGDWGKDVQDEKHTVQSRIVRGTDIPDLISGQLSSAPLRWVEPKKLKSRQIERGDIIIEVSGGSPKQPTGRSIFMTDSMLARLGSIIEPASFCRRFKPSSFNIGLLASLHLQKIYADGKTWEYQNQSTGIANFQTKFFLEAEMVLIPSDKVLEAFCRIVTPLVGKSQNNEQIALAKLRDTLLPKLISGELRLDEVELAVEQEAVSAEQQNER
ncbi:restriction endonuclease subunit S [Vibrio cholerae]|nr:restriction endonuclease subunit S [Vibrio cholerae]